MGQVYHFRLVFAYYDILFYVPARTCSVSFTRHDGIRHSVNVQAETLLRSRSPGSPRVPRA
jgi:hypothetical protein